VCGRLPRTEGTGVSHTADPATSIPFSTTCASTHNWQLRRSCHGDCRLRRRVNLISIQPDKALKCKAYHLRNPMWGMKLRIS